MNPAVLKLYGDIGTDVTDVMVANFLDKNKEAQEVTVRINSFGGDVQTGWTIYDYLKTSGKKIKTVGEGKVHSIATVIFLAGDEREILPSSDSVIHMPRIQNPEGTFQADDFRFMTDFMDKEEEKILNLYTEVTGQDREELKVYMKEETMLSADDMIALGFATKKTEALKPAAYFNLNKLKMDEKTVKTFGEKLDTIIAKMTGFSRISTKAQVITDADGKELTLEKESGSPAVGDKATPDGIFTLASGEKVTVADGVVSEVTPAPESELDKANAKIAELEAKITAADALKAESETAKAEAETAKEASLTKETEAKALVTELSALKNSWKPEGRQGLNTKTKVGDVDLVRVKELLTTKS